MTVKVLLTLTVDSQVNSLPYLVLLTLTVDSQIPCYACITHRRVASESSQKSDFGAFVAVSAFDDPYMSGSWLSYSRHVFWW